MIEFLNANWQWIVLGFYVAEKLVKISKCKWDDILVDGIKSMIMKLIGKK